MQTDFSPASLADPAMAASEAVIRKCVHCGFCTATCPTYVLLGDELDSPRGRIYLMKDMLERESAPTPDLVKHVDRCLSCLACMTTCPSGVNYMHLVDHARAYIERNYRRPWGDRVLRSMLAHVLPFRGRFRAALILALAARPFRRTLARIWSPLGAMLALAPVEGPPVLAPDADPPARAKGRVAILRGCVEAVLDPRIRASTVALLHRAGYDVRAITGEGCCGALAHHMGREQDSLSAARRNVDAWIRAIEEDGITAILITASGCGTAIKNYGFMLRGDPAYAEKAARISALAMDIGEWLATIALPPMAAPPVTVAYHPACSLQHGQNVIEPPLRLLREAGYRVRLPDEAHLCCGSAGVYNILQPEIAGRLGARKAERLAALGADVVATGNIGCATQLARHGSLPVVHLVQLLDWASGGDPPPPFR